MEDQELILTEMSQILNSLQGRSDQINYILSEQEELLQETDLEMGKAQVKTEIAIEKTQDMIDKIDQKKEEQPIFSNKCQWITIGILSTTMVLLFGINMLI